MNSEQKRKLVHVGSSAFALLLRWINFWQAAICALAALLFNWLLLPRIGGRNLYREQDHERGYPIGILLYPLSVLILILLLPNHLYIVAAAWAIMAWGDGFASIVGRRFGTTKLPWNANRSYAGTIAFFLVGGVAAVFFTWWTWKQPPQPFLWYVVAIPILATLLAGIVETIPAGIDDNLTVPLTAGLFMFALYQINPEMIQVKREVLLNNFMWGALTNLILAGVSFALKMVNFSGFASGFLIGTTLFTFGGYELFLILFLFFFLGSASTKFGYAHKKSLGIAQEKGGARGWKNAVANCSVGVFLSILAMLSHGDRSTILIAGVFGAFATAAADTVSSEIGQVLGKHPILITSLRPVPVGTEGAVSLEGTLAGIVASIVVCAAGVLLRVLSIPAALFCVLAAFIGTTVESYLGATLETMKIIDNEIINFMNTLVGAAAAMAFVALFL
jgi:uncharacterized protein (TIGR00297 family)